MGYPWTVWGWTGLFKVQLSRRDQVKRRRGFVDVKEAR